MNEKQKSAILCILAVILGMLAGYMAYDMKFGGAQDKYARELPIRKNPIYCDVGIIRDNGTRFEILSDGRYGVLTMNFFALIFDTWFGAAEETPHPQDLLEMRYHDGTVFKGMIDTENCGIKAGGLRMAIGTGTGTPQYDDFNLFRNYTMTKPDTFRKVNNTHYNITILGFFTPVDDINITEVGLFMSYSGKYVLLVHDVLSPHIEVSANETIGIFYCIYFTQPFTRQFCETLYKYLFSGITDDSFSLRATDGYSTNGFDFYKDSYSNNYIHERLRISFGSWFNQYTMPTYAYASYTDSDDLEVLKYSYNSTHFTFIMDTIVVVSSSTTIYELGVDLLTDSRPEDWSYEARWFILLYFKNETGIHLQAGRGYKFRLTLVFTWEI